MERIQAYTKAILAAAGILIPLLNSQGVALPAFLTVDWVNTILLGLTPILVYYFPNRSTA
jgi:hypothetical protein